MLQIRGGSCSNLRCCKNNTKRCCSPLCSPVEQPRNQRLFRNLHNWHPTLCNVFVRRVEVVLKENDKRQGEHVEAASGSAHVTLVECAQGKGSCTHLRSPMCSGSPARSQRARLTAPGLMPPGSQRCAPGRPDSGSACVMNKLQARRDVWCCGILLSPSSW